MQDSSAKSSLRRAIAEDAKEASLRFSEFEALAMSSSSGTEKPRPTVEDYLRTWDTGLTTTRPATRARPASKWYGKLKSLLAKA